MTTIKAILGYEDEKEGTEAGITIATEDIPLALPDNEILLLTKGSAAGADHKLAYAAGSINNQDAVEEIRFRGSSVGAVICDGCGQRPHCEIGSRFGVNAMSILIENQLEKNNGNFVDWNEVTVQMIERIMEESYSWQKSGVTIEKTLQDYFSFTIIVGLVINGHFIVASCGDGMYLIDDKLTVIKNPVLEAEKEGDKKLFNAPPYIVYNLITSRYDNHRYDTDNNDILSIREIFNIPLSEVSDTACVGSDGFIELAKAKQENIRHPSLLHEPFRLQYWLNEEVHKQDSVALGDDVSAAIFRTKAMQKTLIAERTEVAVLKNKLKLALEANRSLAKEIQELENDLAVADARLEKLEKKKYRLFGGQKAVTPATYSAYSGTYTDHWRNPITQPPASIPVKAKTVVPIVHVPSTPVNNVVPEKIIGTIVVDDRLSSDSQKDPERWAKQYNATGQQINKQQGVQ